MLLFAGIVTWVHCRRRDQEVIEMLETIRNDGGDIRKWVDKAKDKEDPFRLMGFGHRVYKNFDPRATIIKKSCDDLLAKMGVNDPVLDIAKQLETIALNDEYFIERKLYPNVDFYSGIIYRAIGIPTRMFTVMFALGRSWDLSMEVNAREQRPIGRLGRSYRSYERDYPQIRIESAERLIIAHARSLSENRRGFLASGKSPYVSGRGQSSSLLPSF